MKNIMNIGLVNFSAVWGDKETNLTNILSYCDEAGKKGVDLLVFPETALTGYCDDAGKPRNEKMHVKLAETIPGPATGKVAEYAQKYNMYVVFGMPERENVNSNVIYNAAAVVYPDGRIESYRKIHLPFDEANWCIRGNNPLLIDTPWGKIGVSICYDFYCFPELTRYYRAMGARMVLNVTACPDSPCTFGSAKLAIPAYAFVNYMYVVSANLCGQEKNLYFPGGSSVVGIDETGGDAKTYLGKMFGEEGSDERGLIIGEVDMSLPDKYAQIPIFRNNPVINDMDWRAELYVKLYSEAKKKFDAEAKS